MKKYGTKLAEVDGVFTVVCENCMAPIEVCMCEMKNRRDFDQIYQRLPKYVKTVLSLCDVRLDVGFYHDFQIRIRSMKGEIDLIGADVMDFVTFTLAVPNNSGTTVMKLYPTNLLSAGVTERKSNKMRRFDNVHGAYHLYIYTGYKLVRVTYESKTFFIPKETADAILEPYGLMVNDRFYDNISADLIIPNPEKLEILDALLKNVGASLHREYLSNPYKGNTAVEMIDGRRNFEVCKIEID